MKKVSSGFTLIEMIFAVALSSLVLFIVLNFTMFSQDTFKKNVVSSELNENARFALDKVVSQIRVGKVGSGPTSAISNPTSSNPFSFSDESVGLTLTDGKVHPRYLSFYVENGVLKKRTDVYCCGSCPTNPTDSSNVSSWVTKETVCSTSPTTPVTKNKIEDLTEYVSSTTFTPVTVPATGDILYQVNLTLNKQGKNVNMGSAAGFRDQETASASNGGGSGGSVPGEELISSTWDFQEPHPDNPSNWDDLEINDYFDKAKLAGKSKVVIQYQILQGCPSPNRSSGIQIMQQTGSSYVSLDDPYCNDLTDWRWISLYWIAPGAPDGVCSTDVATVTVPLTDFYDQDNGYTEINPMGLTDYQSYNPKPKCINAYTPIDITRPEFFTGQSKGTFRSDDGQPFHIKIYSMKAIE